MKTKPVVGQTLFKAGPGRTAIPVVVTRVGREYFYTGEGRQEWKYRISDRSYVTDWSGGHCLRETEQEIFDSYDYDHARQRLRAAFGSWDLPIRLSLPAMKEIVAILDREATKQLDQPGVSA